MNRLKDWASQPYHWNGKQDWLSWNRTLLFQPLMEFLPRGNTLIICDLENYFLKSIFSSKI